MTRQEYIEKLIDTWTKLPGNRQEYVDHLAALEEIRQTRANTFASNEDKTQRWVLRMPQGLLRFLERKFAQVYQERLFSKEHDIVWFAKEFPHFSIPERL